MKAFLLFSVAFEVLPPECIPSHGEGFELAHADVVALIKDSQLNR